jgi:anti-sigma regulatory factor (Ser/Thr protein kinase)
MCPYDTAKLDPAVVAEARRSHEFVSEAGKAFQSSEFRGIDASGAAFDRPLPEPGSRVDEMKFRIEDLVAIRRLVAGAAEDAGVSGPRVRDFVAAVNEIASNSIRHGGGLGTLRVWHDRARVICEIRDAGRYDRPLGDRERPAPDLSAPRGLWVANQLCDLVQIRTFPEGTVVRLHMQRNVRPNLQVLPAPAASSHPDPD